MQHPELVFMASDRCHVALMRVIYDAFENRRIPVSAKTVSAVYDELMHHGKVPELLEDYCLNLLAQAERQQKYLLNGYEEWKKK